MPPRKSARNAKKEDESKKKDNDTIDEEEDEKPTKGKGKGSAKGKDSAQDKAATKKKKDDDEEEETKPTRRSTRGKGDDKKKAKDDEDDDGVDEEKKPAAKDKRKASKSPPPTATKEPAKKPKGKAKQDEDEDKTDKNDDKASDKEEEKKEEKIVKKIVKGGVAVDEKFTEKDVHVYRTPQKVYAATLNQSNLKNNNNKYYIIQILESEKNKGTFYVWNRWGRVGHDGQTMKKVFNNAQDAIYDYEAKFRDKTVKGDYRVIDINYDDNNEEDDSKKDDGGSENESKLPEATKSLIKLIFDLNMMNNQMKEIGYDANKMPLGKLSKQAIQKGYKILKEISETLKKAKPSNEVLMQLSSDFYSEIPHDFGYQKMINFLIKDEETVKKKLEMLQSIEDIQVATKILEDKKDKDENLIDHNYKKLKTDIKPVDRKSEEYSIIEEYLRNTHATTHNQYDLEILDAFEIDREGEGERFKKDIHNHQLLWHGSRLTNFVGILSQGLRIAPPEAPVTGYMFGKGVYFADMVSKSANYCFTSPANPTGILLLCEVALGNPRDLYFSDYYASNLPAGCHSTKGCGRTAPKESDAKKIGDIKVPCGKGVPTNIPQGSLLYNEFIVYDIAQIKIKYLLKVKFNYKNRLF